MIAGLLQLALFLGTAWLLSVLVDLCYRRSERDDPATTVPVQPARPAPMSTRTLVGSGVRS